MEIDIPRMKVLVDGRSLDLTATEFQLGALGMLIFVVWIGTRGFRSLRTNALALDEVVHSIDRIAVGDYEVRIVERGWPETRDLSRSVMKMASRLRSAESQRISLQSDVAHELRTPLSVIQGTTEGMIEGVYPRDDAHLDVVLRRSRMMADMLDDLRTIATADAGALRLHGELLDVAAVLDRIASDFRGAAEQNGVVVSRVGPSTLDAVVDPVRIAEVVDNLVKNAMRYTSAGDRIELGGECDNDTLRLWVRDTGRGIPDDQIGTIFDRFARSADSGGSGLGLTIAKRLVEAHGDAISVESQPGAGTMFSISIPARCTD